MTAAVLVGMPGLPAYSTLARTLPTRGASAARPAVVHSVPAAVVLGGQSLLLPRMAPPTAAPAVIRSAAHAAPLTRNHLAAPARPSAAAAAPAPRLAGSNAQAGPSSPSSPYALSFPRARPKASARTGLRRQSGRQALRDLAGAGAQEIGRRFFDQGRYLSGSSAVRAAFRPLAAGRGALRAASAPERSSAAPEAKAPPSHWSQGRLAAFATSFIVNGPFLLAVLQAPFVWNTHFRFNFINPLLEPLAENSLLVLGLYRYINWYLLDSVFMPAAIGWFLGPVLMGGGIAAALAGALRPPVRGSDPAAAGRLLRSKAARWGTIALWQAAFFGLFMSGMPGALLATWALSWLGLPLGAGLLKLAGLFPWSREDWTALHFRALPWISFGFFLQASVFLEIWTPPFHQLAIYKDPLDIVSYFLGHLLVLYWWRKARARLGFLSLRRRAKSLLESQARLGRAPAELAAAELDALDAAVSGAWRDGSPRAAAWASFRAAYGRFLERLLATPARETVKPGALLRRLSVLDPEAQRLLEKALGILRGARTPAPDQAGRATEATA